MRTTSFYPGGPEGGPSDLTPAAEVHEARRILAHRLIGAAVRRRVLAELPPPIAWVAEIEQYDSAEELGAARDRELWGDDPFGEDW